ncbi:hypothetical protein GCM10009677_17700 [Sphaerisporangium rubeum]|uniref:Gamma-glutamyl-gamma-aminobutyrate hydrolase PuuD n=1 Tax=Sphaerisporangium rubeum TaxID=321317 RepID=A0A7X0MAC7_9ACTN|nr:hypothetical protein [Sphaerisporangium rubeum]MBB6475851.1 gamma-glutamyl-gamma-aminobutyrate hydrolase PuuD [Sphaerisporangium rubeum]
MTQQITLTLSIPQTNLILEALGQMAYARVYELVDTIHRQAAGQLGDDGGRQARAEDGVS